MAKKALTGAQRNKKYEAERKSKGEVKITVWVPEGVEVEVRKQAEYLCKNRGTIPYMVRSLTTGRMAKCV